MTYIAVIVESPAKCVKIESFLGPGYKCMASYGHLRTIEHLNCIDIDHDFAPTFKTIESKTRQIKSLTNFILHSEEVILATDDDREGEAIAWHICQIFNLPVETTKRIIFHEITQSAIQTAVANKCTINTSLVNAQLARQVLDLIVGFKISPILWSNISFKTDTPLSAGRCQSPALRIIYDNQKNIDTTPGRKVYNTISYFTSQNLDFTLNFNHDTYTTIKEFLIDSSSFAHEFSCGKARKIMKQQPLPFTTSALQQTCSSELKMSPKATMDSCQKLYEAGYITYMRTDSRVYNIEFIGTAKIFIDKKYGSEFILPDIDKLTTRACEKSGSVNNAQEAHEAIRPTDIEVESAKQIDTIGPKEMKVYNIIRRNTLESCMAQAIYSGVTAKITAPKEHEYHYSSEQVIFAGWKVVGGYIETTPSFSFLQTLKVGAIEFKKITSNVVVRDLKSHYTEAKLVQLLEEHGIGRPSTFASLVDKIQERGYVKKTDIVGKQIECIDFELVKGMIIENKTQREFGGEKGKLVIQPVGIVVMDFLIKNFNSLFDYEFTKTMEDKLDLVSKGEYVWHNICRECLGEIELLTKEVRSEKIVIDKNHTYMIAKYGPVIKCVINGETTFKKVREDIDLEQLRSGKYTIDEVIEKNSSTPSDGRVLGKHCEKDVILKQGKFGMYVEWGGAKINVKLESENYDTIELKEILVYLVKPIILEISQDASIRNGDYGPYIYYKTKKMTKPRFISLDSSLSIKCTVREAKDWLLNKHSIKIK